PGAALGRLAAGPQGLESFASREDSSHRSKSLWNTTGPSQMQRTSSERSGSTSPEALERQPDPEVSSERRRLTLAHPGGAEALVGHAEGEGVGGAPIENGSEWFAIDPRFDEAPPAQS